jgi:hypothetical protein
MILAALVMVGTGCLSFWLIVSAVRPKRERSANVRPVRQWSARKIRKVAGTEGLRLNTCYEQFPAVASAVSDNPVTDGVGDPPQWVLADPLLVDVLGQTWKLPPLPGSGLGDPYLFKE